MRKYISIFVFAIVALFTTSCELNGGTTPDPNRANRLLWHRVENALYEQLDYIKPIAQLNDHICGTTYSKYPYEPCNIYESEGIYTMVYGDYSYSYRVVTNKKRLDDGGEWDFYLRYGTYMQYQLFGTVKGIVGESAKFTIDMGCMEWQRSAYYNKVESEVEYALNPITEAFEITFANVDGISSDYTAEKDYLITFKSLEPILFIDNLLISGQVNILYEDLVKQTKQEVTVSIVEKIITFVPNNQYH
jgi:hypothetical protein